MVTLSRFQSLAGGDFDWKRLSYRRNPVLKAGQWMNRALGAEGRVRSGRYVMISTIVHDPVLFRGRSQGRGHGNVVNNCATWCRDAWEFYLGERKEFNGLHTPILLRNAVIRRCAELTIQNDVYTRWLNCGGRAQALRSHAHPLSPHQRARALPLRELPRPINKSEPTTDHCPLTKRQIHL